MPPVNSDDPTLPVGCEDATASVEPVDQDLQKFISLALTYHQTTLRLHEAKDAAEALERKVRTPQSISQRHFTVAEALVVKELDAQVAKGKADLKQAESAHSAATIALDQWIPESLKPFLSLTGCITARNTEGEYPIIGVTKPVDKYMIILGHSEQQIQAIARSEKEESRRNSEW